MERPEKLDGLEIFPADVPKFQAYLRQQLIVEHHRGRLRRSRRAWMSVAVASLAFICICLVRPGLVVQAHYALFPVRSPVSTPEFTFGEQGRPADGLVSGESSLAQAVAASLQRDQLLAMELGGLARMDEVVLPEKTFVVSRFPLSGGREMQIYTSLLPGGANGENGVRFASDGGAW